MKPSSRATPAGGPLPARHGLSRVDDTGARAPHVPVRRAGRPVSTLDLFDGRLTLLTGRRADGWRDAASMLAAYGTPVESLADGSDLVDDGGLARRYGLGDGGAVLVRPDGHCGPPLPHLDSGHQAALTGAVDAVLGVSAAAHPARA